VAGSTRPWAALGGLAVFSLLAVTGSALLGYHPIPLSQIVDGSSEVFWRLRFPRTLLGALAGAGLALSGVVLQALFRNPLATPYTLGVSSGAALAAACGFLLQTGGYWLGIPRLVLFAFSGAMASIGVVFLMARLRGGRDMTRLLLAGVCVSYLSSAGVMLVTVLVDRAVSFEIIRWLVGSLDVARPAAAIEIAVLLTPVLLLAVAGHRALDLLAMGEDLAATRGVPTGRTIWACLLLVALLTGGIVANCGPIGFVGLIVPHVVRTLLGPRTLELALGSALAGAAFLALCDGAARSLSQYEVPVGVLTNLIGATFFFYLLATRDVAFSGR
jgi:iron complex transport system permease protein